MMDTERAATLCLNALEQLRFFSSVSMGRVRTTTFTLQSIALLAAEGAVEVATTAGEDGAEDDVVFELSLAEPLDLEILLDRVDGILLRGGDCKQSYDNQRTDGTDGRFVVVHPLASHKFLGTSSVATTQ